MRGRRERHYINTLIKRDSPIQLSTDITPGEAPHTVSRCPVCGFLHLIEYSDGTVIGEIPKFCEGCGQRFKN